MTLIKVRSLQNSILSTDGRLYNKDEIFDLEEDQFGRFTEGSIEIYVPPVPKKVESEDIPQTKKKPGRKPKKVEVPVDNDRWVM